MQIAELLSYDLCADEAHCFNWVSGGPEAGLGAPRLRSQMLRLLLAGFEPAASEKRRSLVDVKWRKFEFQLKSCRPWSIRAMQP
jgi:hypothetical protein